jgi:predicted nucleic acid-binding protein
MATRVADLVAVPERVMLDTNVLLAATNESRAEHRDALKVLNEWAAGHIDLCTSGQVLREYLSVATRSAEQNGLGWPTLNAGASRSTTRTWSRRCSFTASAPSSP